MELTASEIKEGDSFYGVKTGEWPEFCKFKATNGSGKQVKAHKLKGFNHGSPYEHTLRARDWRYFSDFTTAREAWISSVLDKNIKIAEKRLADAIERKAKIIAADDI